MPRISIIVSTYRDRENLLLIVDRINQLRQEQNLTLEVMPLWLAALAGTAAGTVLKFLSSRYLVVRSGKTGMAP